MPATPECLILPSKYVDAQASPMAQHVRNPPAMQEVGDAGLILGWGRYPVEGNGNPLQYSCLEKPMNRGAWHVTVDGVTKSGTQLSTRHVLRLDWVYLSVVFIRPHAHVQEKGHGCSHPMWPGPDSVPCVQLVIVIFPDTGSGWVGQSSGSVCIWLPGTEFCEDLGQVQKSGTSPASFTSLLMVSETLILILVGAVPVPLIHFNYFDFLKPPGRWRTNSWVYLIRNFILSESLGINTLHFMGRSVLLDEPEVSIQMKSWSRAWLWSSENNQCSKKPLCLQPKAGFTWIYRDAFLMDDVVIWHKYNCGNNNMFILSEPCMRLIVKLTLIEKSPRSS